MSVHNLQPGKTAQIACETAKNMNGPSQSVVDAREWLSALHERPKQKNTGAWLNNPNQQGKEQTMEALREEKTTPILPVDEQNNSKDANYSVWVLQQLVEPHKMSA